MITNTNQMELGFEQKNIIRAKAPNTRAQWWFTQMRRVVALAREWQPAPGARHQQAYLTLASRRS